MDAMEAILTRRSVREYTGQPVGREAIEQMMRAAMAAPSAHNEQPWCFVVVQGRSALDELATTGSHAQMAADAAAAIVVCGDLNLELKPNSWVQDCSAATQNILLAAHALGLGAVWTHCHPDPVAERDMRQLFDLPDHVVPLAVVLIGHPAVQASVEDRFLPDRVHWEKW